MICIIGAGAAGLLLLLLLHPHIRDIVVIDPHFDGGDLCRKWASVISNTRLEQAVQALEGVGSIPLWARNLPQDQPTPLGILGRLIREMAEPALRDCVEQIQATVDRIAYRDNKWHITTSNGKSVRADIVCFTQGSEPNSLHLPIPSIPLDVALDRHRIRSYIQPHDTVLVFGLRHSGTLVLRNCLEARAKSVVGVYRGSKVFSFARDGDYDGIKLDAAIAADEFLTNSPANLHFVRCDDTSCLLSAARRANWVVYATGFCARQTFSVEIGGELKFGPFSYSGQTGEIQGLPSAWGFGLAYPSQAPDGIHWDVGIAPFVEHMRKQISNILSKNSVLVK